MKIATYNIWDAKCQWKDRTEALCREIQELSPDVIGLQEVRKYYDYYPDGAMIEHLAEQTGYQYHTWTFSPKRDEDSGLAFLSRYPFDTVEKSWECIHTESIADALRIAVKADAHDFAVTNVHLGYRKIFEAEKQVIELNNWIESREKPKSYEILLGDFNFVPGSSVHNYLTSRQSLYEQDAKWRDIAESYAARKETAPSPTLDFINNPRWIKYERDFLTAPARVDWILVRENWHNRNTLIVQNLDVFGDKPNPDNGIVASDHYGVYVEMEVAPEVVKYSMQ